MYREKSVWYDDTAGIPAASARRCAMRPRTNSVGECTRSGRKFRMIDSMWPFGGEGEPDIGIAGHRSTRDGRGSTVALDIGFSGERVGARRGVSRRDDGDLPAPVAQAADAEGGDDGDAVDLGRIRVGADEKARGARHAGGWFGPGFAAGRIARGRHGRITARSRARHARRPPARRTLVRHSSGTRQADAPKGVLLSGSRYTAAIS